MFRKNLLYLMSLLMISFACSENKKEFEHAGGTFSMCINEMTPERTSWNVTDVSSGTVLIQVMEGLVSLNPEDLKVKAQLAKSWKKNENFTVYTFKLRDDVYFHENELFTSKEQRKFTAEDVVKTFEHIASKDENGDLTPGYSFYFKGSIKGIDEYHNGKADKIEGIVAKDDEITFTLNEPDANFLYKLSYINAAIQNRNVIKQDATDLMIGTGPFMFKEEKNSKEVILVKNNDYYELDEKGNALPYLDQIVYHVENKKLNELEKFENKEIDFIGSLPPSRIAAMLEGKIKDFNDVPPKLILRNNPLLATNYYFFNMTEDRFKDPRVRQAFNYAINRKKITQEVLRGQAYEDGVFGVVPPIRASFRGYNFSEIKAYGYDYNPEKAKALLAEAGYPNGQGFGSVNLRINFGDLNSAIADEVASQIYATLGVFVNIDASGFEEKDKDGDYAKGDLFRYTWYGDFVSPETFLINFYGKTVPKDKSKPSQSNQSRYINPLFDQYFEQAKQAKSMKESYVYYNKAEIELLKNPPFIPLFYSGDIQLLHANVRNFYDNPLNLFSMKKVYKKDWTKAEYEAAYKK